jgi:hypothetical protein
LQWSNNKNFQYIITKFLQNFKDPQLKFKCFNLNLPNWRSLQLYTKGKVSVVMSLPSVVSNPNQVNKTKTCCPDFLLHTETSPSSPPLTTWCLQLNETPFAFRYCRIVLLRVYNINVDTNAVSVMQEPPVACIQPKLVFGYLFSCTVWPSAACLQAFTWLGVLCDPLYSCLCAFLFLVSCTQRPPAACVQS